jgi:hypothetical protein
VPAVQVAQQQQHQGASGRNPPAIVQPQPAQEVLQQQPQQHAPGGLQDSQQMPPPPTRAAPAQHQQVPRQAEALRDQQQQPQEPAQQQLPGREPPALVDIDAELDSLAAENSQLRQRLTTAARNTATPTQVRWVLVAASAHFAWCTSNAPCACGRAGIRISACLTGHAGAQWHGVCAAQPSTLRCCQTAAQLSPC